MKNTDDFCYRTSRRTDDPDALTVNVSLDDVAARIETGQQLARIYRERFGCNLKAFRLWAKGNLDCSIESVGRYLALYSQADQLREMGLIDLTAAYSVVGATGSITMDHPLWKEVPA